MSFSFVSNGLLQSPRKETKSPEDVVSDEMDVDSTFKFESNGLLNELELSPPESFPSSIPSRSTSPERAAPSFESSPNPFSFVSNGLLSHEDRDDQSMRDAQSVLGSTQDDDESIPRPSQLIPPRDPALPPLPLPERVDSRLVRCRTSDGRTVFFAKRKPPTSSSQSNSTADPSLGNVLDVPLHRMLDDLAREAADRLNSTTPAASAPKKSAEKENLWVDRYRPQRFVDLTGDERVNRETLSWVKEWDQCVFNRAKPKLKRKRDEPVAPAQQDVKVDQWGRPQEKILLISGPPGLGKTTLAHVVAKQAGYDVLEINASDARSGTVIEDRIRPALESGKAVMAMGKKQKPVLVVIDEVDGATGEGSANHAGFINKLVGLTIDPPRRRNPNGTKNARRPLLRPIICVCNDLYAPSLAKLRLCAKIVRIHPSSTHVLTKRLKDICDEESLRTESRALTTLAEVCQGDIRSCLNALQFMKMKGPASGVTQELVRTATVGVKEGDTSVQSVWADLFTPMTKKRARAAGLTDVEEARYVSRLARSVETSGGVDRVALGAFEHYTTLHPHETTLKRFEAANDWLSTYDSFASAAWHDQEYALQAYLPYTIVPLFHHMASNSNAKVERPTAYWESVTKAKEGEEVFAALTKAILYPDGSTQHQTMLSESAGYRYMLGKEVLRTEFVPILNRVISPPMRPVNKQIIKAEERGVLNRLVEIMVSTGLQYEQDKAEDGQLLYRLTPAIDSFIVYDGKRANDIGSARYAVRHMIASEVDEVLSKRQNRVTEKSVGTTGMGRMAKGKAKEDDQIDIADKPAVDFFGRPIVLPQPKTSTVAPPDREKLVGLDLLPKKVATPFTINYRYHEGNSSAVRKPTKVSTFL